MDTRRAKLHSAHVPKPVAATVGFGLAYLAVLVAFALAFERPSAAGWGGFGIVAVVVLVISIAFGQFLARSRG